MKSIYTLSLIIALMFISFNTKAINKEEFGVYKSKEDYLNQNITLIDKMLESDNFNIGILKFKDKENKIHKLNCIKEKYWGFHYIDGNDYMLLDEFYAKIVIVGRINLLISPKAGFSKDENGKYTFTKMADGKINYYFTKDLDPTKIAPFEKLITDEKGFLRSYQKDKNIYPEIIEKQIIYLKKYNAIVPKKKNVKKK